MRCHSISPKLFCTGPKLFWTDQNVLDMVQDVNSKVKSCFWSGQKYFKPVQINLDVSKIIWMCQKQFGPIEGPDIRI